ncbi:hypothetical protein TNCV_2377111 [Trichonephila clavipes]|nr:hypothetical protein TNCV_2377111 [Trichonephila clavipes]
MRKGTNVQRSYRSTHPTEWPCSFRELLDAKREGPWTLKGSSCSRVDLYDSNNFNCQMLVPVVFSENLGISDSMSIGIRGKTVLLCDDPRPCLGLGLPPYTIITD